GVHSAHGASDDDCGVRADSAEDRHDLKKFSAIDRHGNPPGGRKFASLNPRDGLARDRGPTAQLGRGEKAWGRRAPCPILRNSGNQAFFAKTASSSSTFAHGSKDSMLL